MASTFELELFKAIYGGDVDTVKRLGEENTDFGDVQFIIQTDEICLCSTAFENLGLEFTNITSPSNKPDAQPHFSFDSGLPGGSGGECSSPGEGDVSDAMMTSAASMMMSSICSRRVYEPPLAHWLETGRCSHLSARCDNEDILEDLEEDCGEDACGKGDGCIENEDDEDLTADIDLEVYGIRLSPYAMTDDATTPSLTQSTHSEMAERFRQMGMVASTEDPELHMRSMIITDSMDDLQCGITRSMPDMTSFASPVELPTRPHCIKSRMPIMTSFDTASDSDALSESAVLEVMEKCNSPTFNENISGSCEAPKPSHLDRIHDNMIKSVGSDDIGSITSDGPDFHENLNIAGLMSSRPGDDDDYGMRLPFSSSKYPYIHGLDPIDSEVGSGILISDIKQAGVMPLHVAAARGHYEVIEYLLERGCDVNSGSADAEESALHLAVRWGHCGCAKLLLEKGANPNKLSAMECSPMHVAIELSCEECLRTMLAHMPASGELDTATKQIILIYAIQRDQVALAGMLIDQFKLDVNDSIPEACNTLLHKAASCGATNCLKLLLERQANVDATTTEGETALHVAASSGHVECIKALLAAGAKPKPAPNWILGDDQTPLMVATFNNFPAAVEVLLAVDDVHCANEYGDTALHYAAYRGCYDSVSGLLKAGAHVNAYNDYAATPIWNGICYLDVTKCLIQYGAHLDVKSVGHNLDHVAGSVYDSPRRPLEIALEEGVFDCAEVLLRIGARINRIKASKLLEQARKRYELDTVARAEVIEALLVNPHSLKVQARSTILRSIEQNYRAAIKQLTDKEDILSFLQFDEI